MTTQKYTRRLPMTRVTEDLYNSVKTVADALDLSMADVQRAALEWYCTPGTEQEITPTVRIPILGVIEGGKIIPYRQMSLDEA